MIPTKRASATAVALFTASRNSGCLSIQRKTVALSTPAKAAATWIGTAAEIASQIVLLASDVYLLGRPILHLRQVVEHARQEKLSVLAIDRAKRPHARRVRARFAAMGVGLTHWHHLPGAPRAVNGLVGPNHAPMPGLPNEFAGPDTCHCDFRRNHINDFAEGIDYAHPALECAFGWSCFCQWRSGTHPVVGFGLAGPSHIQGGLDSCLVSPKRFHSECCHMPLPWSSGKIGLVHYIREKKYGV